MLQLSQKDKDIIAKTEFIKFKYLKDFQLQIELSQEKVNFEEFKYLEKSKNKILLNTKLRKINFLKSFCANSENKSTPATDSKEKLTGVIEGKQACLQAIDFLLDLFIGKFTTLQKQDLQNIQNTILKNLKAKPENSKLSSEFTIINPIKIHNNIVSLAKDKDEKSVILKRTEYGSTLEELEAASSFYYRAMLGTGTPKTHTIVDDHGRRQGLVSYFIEGFESIEALGKLSNKDWCENRFQFSEDQALNTNLIATIIAAYCAAEMDLHFGNYGFAKRDKKITAIKIDHDQSAMPLSIKYFPYQAKYMRDFLQTDAADAYPVTLKDIKNLPKIDCSSNFKPVNWLISKTTNNINPFASLLKNPEIVQQIEYQKYQALLKHCLLGVNFYKNIAKHCLRNPKRQTQFIDFMWQRTEQIQNTLFQDDAFIKFYLIHGENVFNVIQQDIESEYNALLDEDEQKLGISKKTLDTNLELFNQKFNEKYETNQLFRVLVNTKLQRFSKDLIPTFTQFLYEKYNKLEALKNHDLQKQLSSNSSDIKCLVETTLQDRFLYSLLFNSVTTTYESLELAKPDNKLLFHCFLNYFFSNAEMILQQQYTQIHESNFLSLTTDILLFLKLSIEALEWDLGYGYSNNEITNSSNKQIKVPKGVANLHNFAKENNYTAFCFEAKKCQSSLTSIGSFFNRKVTTQDFYDKTAQLVDHIQKLQQ